MIHSLDNSQQSIAKEMMAVFMESYAIEAALLNAKNFPPLKRPLEGYIDCRNEFFGFIIDGNIAGVIEIADSQDYTHIQSLVVSPKHFRKGIGSQLIEHVFNHYQSNTFMVETGAANEPAIKLYERHGFELESEFDTSIGIRKVRFKRYR